MSTCEASGSGHQLLEELRGSRRTGDLEGNRTTVGLGGHGNASDRPGHQSGQELRAAGLKLRGREGAGDRKVGHIRLRRKTWRCRACAARLSFDMTLN